MNIVVLAAGMGKRMHSDLPKVLHPIAGKPLLGHVLDTARQLDPRRLIVIHGHGAEQVSARFPDHDIHWALQSPPRGTGDAVKQAIDHLDDAVPTLVLSGDVPLTQTATLRALADAAGTDKLALLTVNLEDASGYGRIVRERGEIKRIVEHKDASATELDIREINTGVLIAPTKALKSWLVGLKNDNAQGEYYLTDIVSAAVAENVPVVSAQPEFVWETLGINSKRQLAELERIHQRVLAEALLDDGVHLMDPARLDVRGQLRCGRDVFIDVGCVFEGEVELGDGVHVHPHCVIQNAKIGSGTQVLPYSHIDGANVGMGARIGPFARLRPGTRLGDDTHVGNFVEFKNTEMAAHSKANHLAYVGDAKVGERVNIGAGTITCNYDGANKHLTVIEDDAFIGSDTQLVAPVTVGRGATLGAGTTLTKAAPSDKLTISRARQTTIENWQRPVKTKKPS